jgi:hypothetical protein
MLGLIVAPFFTYIFCSLHTYLLDLDTIHPISAIITIIRIIADQKPALNIPSTTSQEVRVAETAKANSNK